MFCIAKDIMLCQHHCVLNRLRPLARGSHHLPEEFINFVDGGAVFLHWNVKHVGKYIWNICMYWLSACKIKQESRGKARVNLVLNWIHKQEQLTKGQKRTTFLGKFIKIRSPGANTCYTLEAYWIYTVRTTSYLVQLLHEHLYLC